MSSIRKFSYLHANFIYEEKSNHINFLASLNLVWRRWKIFLYLSLFFALTLFSFFHTFHSYNLIIFIRLTTHHKTLLIETIKMRKMKKHIMSVIAMKREKEKKKWECSKNSILMIEAKRRNHCFEIGNGNLPRNQ